MKLFDVKELPVPVKDGAHSRAVRTVPLELRGQQDSIFRIDGAVGEWRDEQLVPAWQMWWVSRTLKHVPMFWFGFLNKYAKKILSVIQD